MTSSCWNFN